MSEHDIERMRHVNEKFMPPAAMFRYALAAGLNGHESQARHNLQLLCQIWKPRNCEDGRGLWTALQTKYPQLRAIDFPEPLPPVR